MANSSKQHFAFHVSRFTFHVSRFAAPLSLALVGVWALGLYVHVLRLPFFRDDMVMLLWLRDMGWGRLWVDATGFPYYRPLSFATLKLSELFFGTYQPQFLHLINLFFHTANSVMIAMLARLVAGEQEHRTAGLLAGLAAGLLYAAYPFSFEVLPTTGPIFQLQASFFALAASLAYIKYRIANSKWQTPALTCTARRRKCVTAGASVANQQMPTFGRSKSANRWLYVSLLMALLGSFTCEYSVIIPPMIIAVDLMLRWQSRSSPLTTLAPALRRASRRTSAGVNNLQFTIYNYLLFFIPTTLYLAIWLNVPKTRSTLPLLWLHELGEKSLYYLQGLTYPFQPAALPLARLAGCEERAWLATALLAAAALGGLVLVFARHKRLDILAFGLFWWATAVAPMWPTLNWDYTSNGPRLHYIPALGTALLWGSAVGLLATATFHVSRLPSQESKAGFTFYIIPSLPRDVSRFISSRACRGTFHVLRFAFSLAIFLAALVPSVLFLRTQADVVLTGGRIVDEVVNAAAPLPPDEPALVVNFPSWIGPSNQTYAMGAEGITFLPGYSTAADLVELNLQHRLGREGARRAVSSLTFTNVWRPWKHTQRFYTPPLNWEHVLPVLRATPNVWLVEYGPDGLSLARAGKILPPPDEPAALAEPAGLVSFEGRLSLARFARSRDPAGLGISLDWMCRRTVGAEWTIFLHAYDAQGHLVAQADGDPLLGMYPVWAWQGGETIHDERYVTLPSNLPPGGYRVGVGLYDRASGARIAATGPDGQRLADDVAILFEWER
jgi:hypothetical protein